MASRKPRIRHHRHAMRGIDRGAGARKRRAIVARWMEGREDTAVNDGIGDTAAATAFTIAAAVAATGVLTLSANVSDGDQVVIGDQTYTFVTALSGGQFQPNEVLIGASASDSIDNLIAAVNGAAGEGTTYGTGTLANEDATAAAGVGDTMDVTAARAGEAGNDVVTTETGATTSWGAATLTGGSDSDVTSVAHGLDDADGPVVLATDDTLPAGLSASTFYWVGVKDVDTFTLHLSREEAAKDLNPVIATDTGVGNHTYALAATKEAFERYLAQGVWTDSIHGLADIDNILLYF